MMLSNFESGYPDDNDPTNEQFLRDIEEISNSLYLDNKPQKDQRISSSNLIPKSAKKSHFPDSKSKPKPQRLRDDEKPFSMWGWKPFKALSLIRHRKFTCFFFCHVHCIENLPSGFDNISMIVHWKRKDNVLRTLPSRVCNGMVEFEETLMRKCSVYGIKNGRGNFVKYEPKHFLLYASIDGSEGLDIGKHWVDLTRLLPLTVEELEEDKCSGKWSTSFKLVGKAKGATLHVSFGFLVTKNGLAELGEDILNLDPNGLNRMSADFGPGNGNSVLRRVGSVPSSLTSASSNSSQCLDVKFLQRGWLKDVSDFSNSINMLCEKLEEGNVGGPTKFDFVFQHLESFKFVSNLFSGSGKDPSRAEFDDDEFTVIEKGIELEWFPEEEIKSNESAIEVIDIDEMFKDEGISDVEFRKESNTTKEGLDLRFEKLELSIDESSDEIKINHKESSKMEKSLSLDDVTKAVADDFFNLLQEKHSPSTSSSNGDIESPREHLLRQFEEEMITSGSFLLGVDEQENGADLDYAFSSIDLLPVTGITGQKSVKQSPKSKMKAKFLERVETKSLMQRWGLDEETFENSSHYSTSGFGSPIFIPSKDPVALPPIGEGLEPVIELKDGGFVRSMSPLLFENAKNCGSLIIQASKPVVLPRELGSDILEILECMASVGVERLSKQVHKLMPLEDLSGKTMHQLAWEASSKDGIVQRAASSEPDIDVDIEVKGSSRVPADSYLKSSSTVSDIRSEYVSVKDLIPSALDHIEVLAIEGLRIQSGMSDQDSPSSIRVKSKNEVTSRHDIVHFHESSYFSGITDTPNHFAALLDLSISLDEWLRLDAEEYTQITSGKSGFLEDSLTIALIMQLRDPLRNYEPVGAPMLGLIQAERIFRPSTDPNSNIDDNERINEKSEDDKDGQVGVPWFRVNEVHVSGLNAEIWASKRQQQSGSRWLLASGLTKNRDSQFSKSRSINVSTRVLRNPCTTNFMWSILFTQDRITRNPDIIFPE